ncbi:hypothetical protein BG004_008390 [Podila humilis]|nr:hypothetical protein BG004_008390 [Podila humilis]
MFPPARPSSLHLSDCLLLPASSVYSAQLDYSILSQCSTPSPTSPAHARARRTRPTTARLSKLSQKHHRHRPSRRVLESTPTAIFGHWDIHIKPEPRYNARAHARISSLGSSRPGGVGSAGPGIATGASGNTPTVPSATAPVAALAWTGNTTKSAPTPSLPTTTTKTTASDKVDDQVALSRGGDRTSNTTNIIDDGTHKTSTPPPASTMAMSTTTTATTTTTAARSSGHAAGPFSARATFLKALDKFKNKNKSSKRASAPPPASFISIPMSDTTTSSSIPDRRSFILPPIHFGDDSNPPPDSSLPSTLETPAPQPSPVFPAHHRTLDQDTAMAEPMTLLSLEDSPHSPPHAVSNTGTASSNNNIGHPSLRVKFKNRVSHTLASIKSSSNLRDKAKAQDPTITLASVPSTPASPTSHSSTIASDEVDSHRSIDRTATATSFSSSGSKGNRPSKSFWTFPRVRPDSVKHRPHSVMAIQSSAAEHDVTMASVQNKSDKGKDDYGNENGTQAKEERVSEELDSDRSIDFILPADYEDYTQFAELSLKKRKKFEAAFAANGSLPSSYSNKRRPNSVRASTDAVKRFLATQKQESQQRQYLSPSSKKVSESQGLDGAKTLSRSQGDHWRRSLLKSLHLGKGKNQGSQKMDGAAPAASKEAALSVVDEDPQYVSPVITIRPTRSDSVYSTRSRSMATSTHPGLFATTLPRPRGPGLRRETLEMAMRRRRQSSAARSNISDNEIPSPLPRHSEFFGLDNYSTTNITHTFTSFTLELADMYAQDVMNNSVTPGLFNFKRRATRMTMSSHILEPDTTDQSFRGFDSDGDAISGYTGDADVSMDEIYVQPRTPTTMNQGSSDPYSFSGNSSSHTKGPDLLTRRKLSSIDGDSDVVPELPTLTIRTRDLNNNLQQNQSQQVSLGSRGSFGANNKHHRTFTPRPESGSSFDMTEQDEGDVHQQACSPIRRAPSPTMTRKTSRTALMGTHHHASRGFSAQSPKSPKTPKSPSKRQPMSMEEITSWKPRQLGPSPPHPMATNPFHVRPLVPALDTRKPTKNSSTKGSGMSSSTTLIGSSRTPFGYGGSSVLSQSPGGLLLSPSPLDTIDEGDSSSHQHRHASHSQHHGQGSSSSTASSNGDLARPFHPKGISGVSTLSAASSDFSAHTRYGSGDGHKNGSRNGNGNVAEFDPSQEFPPTTPVDLRGMDFEALLVTAEREHQKGWEDLKVQKGGSDGFEESIQAQLYQQQQHQQRKAFKPLNQEPLKIAPVSALKSTRQNGATVAPLRSTNQNNFTQQQQQQQQQRQQKQQTNTNSVAFDLGPSDGDMAGTGTGTGSDRSSRSKRVMKKKMSVIRLAGHGSVQGKREQDGVIRVSMSAS